MEVRTTSNDAVSLLGPGLLATRLLYHGQNENDMFVCMAGMRPAHGSLARDLHGHVVAGMGQ